MIAGSDGLDPVRAALLRAARASADAMRERARADADDTLRSARAAAEEVLARARDLGGSDGAAGAARVRVRALQDAWAVELAARAEVYAALRAAIRAGVRRALEEDTSARVRLAGVARDLLGPGAAVTPLADGGVTAGVPGRRVDLSADALADRALDRLGVRAESLWRPE
ncbi:hypothetical protein [Streptomyces cinerochromogenes]|uniref:hypothetical protein n=1 Tax=Streptomyces cinerochromogenes TaxID=66422 RepID=UPI001670026B|nr:hypothetical protein [Streptomyces cinerochromogenes]GGS55498.1 hypothetical protein GCM10010206_16700 [Streptomyces cinerochromogenes]